MPLATVRKLLAELAAAGEMVMCQLTRYEGTKTIEAWQCRVSGVRAGAGPGQEAEGGVAGLEVPVRDDPGRKSST